MSCQRRHVAARIGAMLLALALVVLAPRPSLAESGSAPRLLLLPIVVHSAEDPEYLRNGLADMLMSRFARIGAIELLVGDRDGRGTSSLDKALALGRKAGADYVLFGSFTRFGQGASLDVQCAPTAEGRSRAPLREIFVHSGSIGEIIPDLDELAGKVSRFARGEVLAPAALAADGSPVPEAGGAMMGSAAAQELQSLRSRVEVLEDTIQVLLDQ
ncbi:MAG: hypothetical protein CL908_17080 [Deltaproteobacteria bacterium]|nr:hypothetical protein [Deltaproteobacteria bacterium]